MDLRAGTAGTGVPHLPEVLLLGEAEDAPLGNADADLPQVVGLVVIMQDRDDQIVGIDPEHASQEVPGVIDRLLLEVVAKGEVAEHLEERLMTR